MTRAKAPRVALGVALNDPSTDAVGHAVLLADARREPLVLIHVSPSQVETQILAEQAQQLRDEQLGAAENRLAELAESLVTPEREVTAEVVEGDPKSILAETASGLGASLLVVGTHGRTGVPRFLLGSVAERAVRASDIDVFVARGEAGPFQRILVPTDFSDESVAALETAIGYAAPEAAIDVLHCWEIPVPVSSPDLIGSRFVEPLRSKGLEHVVARGEALVKKWRSRHETIEFVERNIPASYGIQDQLEDNGYDLVVMGSHGRAGLTRWVLGSVAEVTVRHAPCSVLVVKSATD